MDDCPEIIENRDLMYMEGNTAHCILFLDANGSDGWGEGFEQREIKTDAFGTIYVSFWNSSDSWQIEAEMTATADIEEEESLDMGGISM